jgi:hypothetical protein
MKLRAPWFLCLFLIFSCASQAKDQPLQEIVWPPSGTPVMKFTIQKLRQMGSSTGQRIYAIDMTAENLWNKKINQANFALYLFDKEKARIGEGWIVVTSVAPGETIKFQPTVQTRGTPVSFAVAPRTLPSELQSYLPPKTISITVNSVPQGATVKVDGVEAGTTPKIVQVTPGKHMLEFSKEGFNNGRFPMEVGPDDVSGGSLSYELGSASHDTVELRDGNVLSGDVESVTSTEVIVRIGGNSQHFNRNRVKRILLIERDTPPQ